MDLLVVMVNEKYRSLVLRNKNTRIHKYYENIAIVEEIYDCLWKKHFILLYTSMHIHSYPFKYPINVHVCFEAFGNKVINIATIVMLRSEHV